MQNVKKIQRSAEEKTHAECFDVGDEMLILVLTILVILFTRPTTLKASFSNIISLVERENMQHCILFYSGNCVSIKVERPNPWLGSSFYIWHHVILYLKFNIKTELRLPRSEKMETWSFAKHVCTNLIKQSGINIKVSTCLLTHSDLVCVCVCVVFVKLQ